MKKLLSLLLMSLLMVNMASPALGSDYRESAILYLTEKYNVREERIELYEGGVTELQHISESFWFAKFSILPEGVPKQEGNGEIRTLPAPEPAPDAAYDLGTAEPAILPAPPRDIVDDGYLYGGVYIRLKTGEILELKEMERYYEAERRLAEQEWERLRQEAGKLEVSLYQKLQGLSAAERVAVRIEPVPVETDEVIAQFAVVKGKYPELSKGMQLVDFLPYGYFPGFRGGTEPSGGGSGSYAVSDPVLRGESPSEKSEIIAPVERPDIDNAQDEEYWLEQNAFWQELEHIRQQSIAPSLDGIRNFLTGIGVAYQENGMSISADLTAAEIRQVSELPVVATVFEEMLYDTMDKDMAVPTLGTAPNERNNEFAESAELQSKRYYLPVIILFAALIVALAVIRRRSVHNG
jgi:hypothetical protein